MLENERVSDWILVCVFMLKRTLCLKLVEIELGMGQRFTAIRKLHHLLSHLDQSLPSRCPCLTCSVKIAQVGISEVVYSYDYNVDTMVSDTGLDEIRNNSLGRIYIQGSWSQVKTVHTGKFRCLPIIRLILNDI